jgi:hypothetical protein
MSRRKGEVTAAINERNFPHIVELPLPSGGFRSQSDDMLAFHRERRHRASSRPRLAQRQAVLCALLLCRPRARRRVPGSVRRREDYIAPTSSQQGAQVIEGSADATGRPIVSGGLGAGVGVVDKPN